MEDSQKGIDETRNSSFMKKDCLCISEDGVCIEKCQDESCSGLLRCLLLK
jgi:hypothetical protein